MFAAGGLALRAAGSGHIVISRRLLAGCCGLIAVPVPGVAAGGAGVDAIAGDVLVEGDMVFEDVGHGDTALLAWAAASISRSMSMHVLASYLAVRMRMVMNVVVQMARMIPPDALMSRSLSMRMVLSIWRKFGRYPGE